MVRGIAIGALLGAFAMASCVSASPNKGPSGLHGTVVDGTCYGPCAENDQPEPYRGEDLVLVIRSAANGELVRRIEPPGPRYATRLRPGSYRITARIEEANGKYRCWEGQTKRAGVKAHRFTRVRLLVGNSCIV